MYDFSFACWAESASIDFNDLKFWIHLFDMYECLSVCICVQCVCYSSEGRKRVPDPLELGFYRWLWAAVYDHCWRYFYGFIQNKKIHNGLKSIKQLILYSSPNFFVNSRKFQDLSNLLISDWLTLITTTTKLSSGTC